MSEDTSGNGAPQTPTDSTVENEQTMEASKKPESEKSVPLSRFSEVIKERNALSDRLKKIEDQMKQQEQAELEHKQEFQKLYEQEKESRSQLESQLRKKSLENAFIQHASGVIHKDALDMAFNAIDQSQLSVKDDGTVEGMDIVVGKLVEQRPFLKSQPDSTPGVNPSATFEPASDAPSDPSVKYTKAQVEAYKKMSPQKQAELSYQDPKGWREALVAYN